MILSVIEISGHFTESVEGAEPLWIDDIVFGGGSGNTMARLEVHLPRQAEVGPPIAYGDTVEVVLPIKTAPIVIDVPYASQVGNELVCTMGNWEGEPTDYAYEWKRDDGVVLGATDEITITLEDVGHNVHCTVAAENAIGSTTAPPSNVVTVLDPADAPATASAPTNHHRRRHRKD